MKLKIVESKRIISIASWFSQSRIIGCQFLFWLFVHDYNYWDKHRTKNTIKWTHENIHFEQGKELGFVFFWILYVLLYIINLFRFKFDKRKAYKENAFELEAYRNDGISGYLDIRENYNWVKWL